MNMMSPKLAALFTSASLLLSPMLPANTMHVSEDAHIDLGNENDNLGTVPNLVVSNLPGKRNSEKMAFLSYDVLPLPDGANLEQAWLRLYLSKVGSAGTLDLYLVSENWDEHSLTAMTAPDFGALPFTSYPVSEADEGHFVVVEVTPEVQAWLDGSTANHGFVFMADPGTELDVSFDSKESPQSSHQSELELVLGVAEGGVDSTDIEDGSITSDDIADETIGSDDIADGSIGSDDIADGSIGSDDIADGSIGNADVDKDAIQLRVSGSCAAGSSIRVIDNMGGVSCEPDDDSGGDITSVFPITGGGLTGGADSGDAKLGIAPGGVDSSKIADGTVAAADVDSNAIQLRVGSSCPAGQSIRAIAANGGVTCEVDDDSDTTLDPSLFWQVDGNAGTNPIPVGPNFLGTTDDTELVLGVNGEQAMRLAYVNNGFTGDLYLDGINLVQGHWANKVVNSIGGTVGGGGSQNLPNKVEAGFGTIGGGLNNGILAHSGTIGGGSSNEISGFAGAIVGGSRHLVAGSYAFIGGGVDNISFSSYAAISGGQGNEICEPGFVTSQSSWRPLTGEHSFIGGGSSNISCGDNSVVSGGSSNVATGRHSTVLGGTSNETTGDFSIAGGDHSRAFEDHSAALGHYAKAIHEGAFVWSDASTDADFESQRPNQFRIEATGGARFEVGDDLGTLTPQWVDLRTIGPVTYGADVAKYRVIDTSTGAYLSLGGTWVNSSDVNRKTDFGEVDVHHVLDRVVSLPMQTWRYKIEGESIRHIGPMAQDFQASFGFGGDPRGITSVDADGVALAAIQALYQVTQKLEQRTAQLESQQARIDTLEAAFADFKARLAPLQGERFLTSLEN